MFNFLFLTTMLSVGLCSKPNFVIFLTDDQDVVLGGMNPMKNVQRFIGNEGVTFDNSYTTVPICCPSRASILTGLYMHNHQTRNNSLDGGCYGPTWKHHEQYTFPKLLNDAGYNTFYAGKYLNQYGEKAAGGPEVVPPGWTEWHGLVGNSVYYNYVISNNGVPTQSTDLYLTDVIRDLGVSFIKEQKDKPFLMMLSPPAPHQPFTPAPRHKGKFQNVTAVRDPNFNIAVKDKHWLMSMPPSPLPEKLLSELDRVYSSRWETLLAVDEMVGDVVAALEEAELINNTYLIYTSDNGYHIGQFSQVYDKRTPYETDIKIPLVIKGPNVPKNTHNSQPVLNIDLAPTILDLAGVQPLKLMDGHKIEFDAEEVKERNMLIEYSGEGNDGSVSPDCRWIYDKEDLSQCFPQYGCKCQDAKNNTFSCLRHIGPMFNFKYCMFADREKFVEAYDLYEDPYELKNCEDRMFPSLRIWYMYIMRLMSRCKGAEECDNPQSIPTYRANMYY